MTQTDAERKVLQALGDNDGALTPYGSARAQMQDTTAYVAVPINLVEHFGISQGHEVQRAFHAETGCLVSCLRHDVQLFDM
jgi:hypothetical protein